MIKNQDPKFKEVKARLKSLQKEAKAICLEIEAKFGEIGYNSDDAQYRVLHGKIEKRHFEDTTDNFWDEVKDTNLNIQILGNILNNTSSNLGI